MARILIGNIKGPKGDTGLQGIQGEIGPVGPQGPLPTLVNNALATTPGVAALDAAMGKTLQDQLDTTNSNLTNHKTSGDHDGRYYTETEIDNKLGGILQSGVYDLSSPPNAYMFFAGPGSTNLPSGLGGNSYLVLQLFPGNPLYNALLAFSFASDKIAINRRANSTTWTGWKYVSLA